VACILMVIDHSYPQFGKIRANLSLVVYPIQKIVDFPITTMHKIGGYFVTQKRLLAENQWLQQEHLIQQGRLQKLAALETENQHLRQLMQSASHIEENLLIANIINIDPDPFTHQVMINKGIGDNVHPGQTIIDSEGIMGTVISVNDLESRAILITDGSHAVPVENVRNGLRAIAVGTGGESLELRHVPKTTDIAVGDIMVTSGLGGRYPVGFPVGKVKEVKYDPGKPFAKIIVTPSAKLDRSRHILLIQNVEPSSKGIADEKQ
jgi:rod shape-determining protein MreC